MKKAVVYPTLLTILMVLTGTSRAAQTNYITGEVVKYEAGYSITIEGDDGAYSFTISDNTEINGNITKGTTVKIEAKREQVLCITVLEKAKPVDEWSLQAKPKLNGPCSRPEHRFYFHIHLE